jgi:Uma2 family endonuclease
MVQKKRLYARFGIREYWIVVPESEEIEVYTLKNNDYQLYKIYSMTNFRPTKQI